MDERELLFVFLRREVCGELSEGSWDNLSSEQLEKLFVLSTRHDLAHIPGQALRKLGVRGTNHVSVLLEQKCTEAIYRYTRQDYTYEQVRSLLSQAEIPFIPLKGAVLRQYYPEPWLRTSCDIDILVKESDLERAIQVLNQTLHCQYSKKGDHDISLYTPQGIHIELHFDTIQQRYAVNDCRDVLAGIWDDAQPDKTGAYGHHMSDEMFYFYHIAHMAKHFGNGGCGVRPFLDIWVLNHKVSHDRQKREDLLREGGLLTFARKAEKLAEVWFSKSKTDALTERMSDYILRAGVYGNRENRAAVGQARMGGRIRYLLSRRVFMPYDYLKDEYPILIEQKWLFPFYQVVRWFSVLKKGLVRKKMRELGANVRTTKSEVQETKELLKELGL